MDISRRAIFALPIALPVALTMRADHSTAWTSEEIARESATWEERARAEALAAQEFNRGSGAGWVEVFEPEHDIGYLKCFDGRLAFFNASFSDYDPASMHPGTKVFVYWRERPNSFRAVDFVKPWVEA